MKLYRCHWRVMPEITCLVAALTRGKAKRAVFNHVNDIFVGVEFVDCYAQAASLDEDRRFERGELTPQICHADGRGEWQCQSESPSSNFCKR